MKAEIFPIQITRQVFLQEDANFCGLIKCARRSFTVNYSDVGELRIVRLEKNFNLVGIYCPIFFERLDMILDFQLIAYLPNAFAIQTVFDNEEIRIFVCCRLDHRLDAICA